MKFEQNDIVKCELNSGTRHVVLLILKRETSINSCMDYCAKVIAPINSIYTYGYIARWSGTYVDRFGVLQKNCLGGLFDEN